MRTVYLVRHGMVDFPGGKRRCIGRTDLPLNYVGRKQAEDLREYFRSRPIEAVFTSPLERTLETARILAEDRLPVQESEGLMELYMGEWENVPLCDLKKGLESEPILGEGREQGVRRMDRAVRDILARTSGDVVVVAHGGINCCYLAGLTGQPLATSRALTQPYGGISRIIIDDNGRIFAAEFGRKPRISPCDRECRDIWDHYGTPERVRRHCVAVACHAVGLGALLSKAGYPMDMGLIRSAALLHDVVREKKDHAAEGAGILVREGYPMVADVIRHHHDLAEEILDETAVVYLADKLIQGEREVSLDERFTGSRAKCQGNAQAMEAHERRYRQAKAIQDMVKRCRQCTRGGEIKIG